MYVNNVDFIIFKTFRQAIDEAREDVPLPQIVQHESKKKLSFWPGLQVQCYKVALRSKM